MPRIRERRSAVPGRATRKPTNLVTVGVFVVAAIGALHLTYPQPRPARAPFAAFLGPDALPFVRASANAFGRSGEVKVRFAMPGQTIEFPLQVEGDPSELRYAWTRVGQTRPMSVARPLAGANVAAPQRAGFYRLVLVKGKSTRAVDGLTVAVLRPFDDKVGGMLNGYRLGTYISERFGGNRTPEGFLEITPADLELPVTKHLRVADFVSHDAQQTWPRYAAVSPKLLDKLELVVSEIARWRGNDKVTMEVDVKSGFRSPDHNRRVRRAARDSRHQYGDAADVAIDANGDGKLTAVDSRLVGLAVEIIEMRHPELAGGLGLYLRGRTPYVHIDARGKRARWRG